MTTSSLPRITGIDCATGRPITVVGHLIDFDSRVATIMPLKSRIVKTIMAPRLDAPHPAR
jgi:hypothetical protein